jgi:hypothetical protein
MIDPSGQTFRPSDSASAVAALPTSPASGLNAAARSLSSASVPGHGLLNISAASRQCVDLRCQLVGSNNSDKRIPSDDPWGLSTPQVGDHSVQITSAVARLDLLQIITPYFNTTISNFGASQLFSQLESALAGDNILLKALSAIQKETAEAIQSAAKDLVTRYGKPDTVRYVKQAQFYETVRYAVVYRAEPAPAPGVLPGHIIGRSAELERPLAWLYNFPG